MCGIVTDYACRAKFEHLALSFQSFVYLINHGYQKPPWTNYVSLRNHLRIRNKRTEKIHEA